MPKSQRVTIHDVAELSQVSYQTVSRVINNHPNVAKETRERVLAAIAQLDYHLNKAAQSLASGRSRTIATIAFGLDYYGPAQMAIHIEKAAHAAGYDLILFNAADTTKESLRLAIQRIQRWQVDGVLVITPTLSASYDELAALRHMPVVQIDPQQGSPFPSVAIDQRLGSEMVTEYLIHLGHQHICEIRGPQDWFGAVARHEGWLETMQRHGLEPGESVEGNWTAKSGYDAAQALLASGEVFTALVVGNDQMALGAVHALNAASYRVPEDVSIVGFDDIPEAAYFNPPLTTIRQDFAALGRLGMEYLIECINQPDQPPQQRLVQPHFVERRSVVAR